MIEIEESYLMIILMILIESCFYWEAIELDERFEYIFHWGRCIIEIIIYGYHFYF
jgi:hypothetical protein